MFRKTMFAVLGAGMLMCGGATVASAQSPVPVAPAVPQVMLNPQPLPPGIVAAPYVVTQPVAYRYRRAYYPSRYYYGPRVVYRSYWRGFRR